MNQERAPCNVEIEKLILGSVMLNGRRMDDLRGAVERDYFHLERHRRIWAACCALYDAGVPVDRVVVLEELERRNQREFDTLSYLVSLDDGLPELANLESYMAILREKATLRRVLLLADHIAKRCLAGDSAEDVTQALSSAVLELGGADPDKRAISTREMIEQRGIDELLRPRRTEGLQLPWERLNNAICGLSPGQVVVMAADTGRGKTSFSTQVATHVTRQGKSPIIWALEMAPRQYFLRMVNQIAHTDADRGRHGMLTGNETTRRTVAASWLHDHPVWFDRHSRTVPSFCASVRQAKAKSDTGLAIVDYLQLIRSSGRAENRAREVGENSRALKLAAMELEMPFLVLSQFRRVGDKEADIHTLKDSGDIENDADVILLLNAPKMDGTNSVAVTIKIGKQREGPAGFDIPLMFHPPSQSFSAPEDSN